MTKKPFTTRLDDDVLAKAQQVAKAERRSVTALIELALVEYFERHGFTAASPAPSQDEKA